MDHVHFVAPYILHVLCRPSSVTERSDSSAAENEKQSDPAKSSSGAGSNTTGKGKEKAQYVEIVVLMVSIFTVVCREKSPAKPDTRRTGDTGEGGSNSGAHDVAAMKLQNPGWIPEDVMK